MKIAIDISQVAYGTGVSVYTKELVRALLKLDTKNTYLLFAGVWKRKADIHAYIDSLSGRFIFKEFLLPPRAASMVWNDIHVLPVETLLGKIDVLHTSDWTEPRALAPKVTTIHDISPILFPEVTHPRIRATVTKKINIAKREGDLIIVPTESIKDDLIKYGFLDTRVIVIPEGLNPSLTKSKNIDLAKRFGINSKFVLMVGTAKRKNTDRSLEALSKSKLKDMTAVVVGEKAADSLSSKNVIFTGRVTDDELASLYRQAELLLYPSLYEGFGLPIIEAFALGCPVVTSNIGSMLEVASSAAVLVDPLSTQSISRGILEAIKNRKTLVKSGQQRVKSFTWEKAAKLTLEVYTQAYAKK